MPLYTYIRNLKHTLATSLGFGFIVVGITLSIKLILKEFNGLTNYQTVLGISSTYYMLAGYLIPFLLFFKKGKRRYYLFVSIGLLIVIVVSFLEFFNVCACDYIIEGDISLCQWSVVLFSGMLILKRLE